MEIIGKSLFYNKLSKISFIVFLFFSFFGTSLPFSEKIKNVNYISTSNIMNQIVYTVLFIISVITLLEKKKEIKKLINSEKYLTMFLLWCVITLFWSKFQFVSFKRLLQIFTTVTVSTSILLHVNTSNEILNYFKYIIFPFTILTILAIFFIPNAIDPLSGAWKGMSMQKNQFGQICLVNLFIWTICYKSELMPRKTIYLVMFFITFILLFKSKSLTSIITFILLFITLIILKISNHLKKYGFGNLFLFYIFLLLTFSTIFLVTITPNWTFCITEFVGKDVTLTGRTYLWEDIIDFVYNHLIIGCGFSGFWVISNPDVLSLYQKYTFLPKTSHMGYLDILNETGLVGIFLFSLLIIGYLKLLINSNRQNYWSIYIFLAIIVNIAETTFFSPNSVIGKMFIFSYLSLHTENIKIK